MSYTANKQTNSDENSTLAKSGGIITVWYINYCYLFQMHVCTARGTRC